MCVTNVPWLRPVPAARPSRARPRLRHRRLHRRCCCCSRRQLAGERRPTRWWRPTPLLVRVTCCWTAVTTATANWTRGSERLPALGRRPSTPAPGVQRKERWRCFLSCLRVTDETGKLVEEECEADCTSRGTDQTMRGDDWKCNALGGVVGGVLDSTKTHNDVVGKRGVGGSPNNASKIEKVIRPPRN
jgi:hypothetical protein